MLMQKRQVIAQIKNQKIRQPVRFRSAFPRRAVARRPPFSRVEISQLSAYQKIHQSTALHL